MNGGPARGRVVYGQPQLVGHIPLNGVITKRRTTNHPEADEWSHGNLCSGAAVNLRDKRPWNEGVPSSFRHRSDWTAEPSGFEVNRVGNWHLRSRAQGANLSLAN